MCCIAAAAWPPPLPSPFVTHVATASPPGVTATEGHSALRSAAEIVSSAPKGPPACGRVAACTAHFSRLSTVVPFIHESTAEPAGPPARLRPCAPGASCCAAPKAPAAARVKPSSAPPPSLLLPGLAHATVAVPSPENAAATVEPELTPVP